MAVNLLPKKTQYALNAIAAAAALKGANDQMVSLLYQWQNQFNTGQNAAITDADLAAATGTAHMTQAQLAQFFSSVQPAVATAVAGQLQALLAVLPL